MARARPAESDFASQAGSKPGPGALAQDSGKHERLSMDAKQTAAGRPDKVVLVVDDEPLVRMNAVDMFEDLGFEVLEASNGLDAVAQLEERPDVTLLFSDCRMPGMSGQELADIATRRWPRLRVVLVSGFVNVRPENRTFLSKPYDLRAIERVIRDSR